MVRDRLSWASNLKTPNPDFGATIIVSGPVRLSLMHVLTRSWIKGVLFLGTQSYERPPQLIRICGFATFIEKERECERTNIVIS
jgi:hypothetical protein